MQINIFAVQDSKAGIFMQPFPSVNELVALRGFADAAKNKETNVGKHPEDFNLYMLGTFDDTTGRFENLNTPKMLGSANQYSEPR